MIILFFTLLTMHMQSIVEDTEDINVLVNLQINISDIYKKQL